ncbi:MAG: RNA-binding protein [Phycisphaerae bacterium]|nr:RNA-binding protein [Phycisphaerae bacterium]
MKIYVGNLAWKTDTEGLRELFEQFGSVSDAIVISDRETGRSRGFGFVTMDNDDEARAAIDKANGMDMDGRPLRVNEAQPREQRR